MKHFISSLKTETKAMQEKMKNYTPWLFAGSLVAKLVLIALVFVAAPNCANAQAISAGEQEVMVNNIQNYLNGITTMKADFAQLSQDGETQNGKFYLSRPGRLRFEYNPPNGDYIVADGLLVHYWDNGVKNYSNAPIGSTLADFLLRKKITFSGDIKVESLKRPATNKLLITFVQGKGHEGGDLRMLFTESPLELLKWRVTDGAGNVTEVTLNHVQSGLKLDPKLFVFKAPKGYEREYNQN